MNTYELTLITKTEADATAGKKYIEEFEGEILEQKPSATRPLAYPVKKETQGVFTVLRFSMEPEKVFEMNKKLVLDEKILRHIVTSAPVVRVEKAAEPAAQELVEEAAVKPAKAKKVPAKPKKTAKARKK
jgi:small subunit ribosomal protein S6